PSIAPWQANGFFSKLECFCFSQQTLAGNERKEMPVRFVVSPDLPPEIDSLTLSYNVMRFQGPLAAAQ
ncbi:MAG: cytochrome c oxidase assembly protein, partial [Chromatiaceae bacterium]|nr:cytochrome c oxidase assembly protein [Chromatiaceae bacterium]